MSRRPEQLPGKAVTLAALARSSWCVEFAREAGARSAHVGSGIQQAVVRCPGTLRTNLGVPVFDDLETSRLSPDPPIEPLWGRGMGMTWLAAVGVASWKA